MIPQSELKAFFGDFENTVVLPNDEARGCLWTLAVFLEHTKFDPHIDIEDHVAKFLSRVKNPSEETYKAALGLVLLFGRRLGKVQAAAKKKRK